MTPDDPRHGTRAGYLAHQRAGTPACDACLEARRDYMREYRARPDAMPRVRRGNRARSRAVWRLAQLYPDDYQRLMAEELAKENPPRKGPTP